MSDAIPPASDPRASTLRTTNTLLALAILILLGQIAWQELRISGLKAEVAQTTRELETRVARLANEKVQGHRRELVAAVTFVDDLYRSDEGLQRPGGLYNPEARQVDAEAIGTWILDVYMQARIAGKSDAEARQTIAGAIKGSDEWRRKHGGK
ncbi:MAG: hypothetical protein ACKOEC_16160 [Acidimicrobiia bacterium]